MSKHNLAFPLQDYQQPEPRRRFRLIQGGLCRHKPESDDLRGERAVVDRSLEFKRWLALFFIEQGRYKITEKGYGELAPQIVRSDTHFGEHDSARERSLRLDLVRPLTRPEIREAVAAKIEEMIREGKAEELYNKGLIDRLFHLDWQNKEVRVVVIKKLLEFLGKDSRDVITHDFYNNRLSGLLVGHYNSSLYLALVEAGYAYSEDETLQHAKTGEFKTDRLYPWEMKKAPARYYYTQIRISATKWLLWKLKKDPKEMTYDDFHNNGLGGLLSVHYNNSPYLALVEAGYAYSLDEILEHAKTGEFKTDKIYPWEISNAPQLYHKSEIRVAATKWLVWKLKEYPRKITKDNFERNGLSGLLNHYKGSPYLALVEAGLVTSADEVYMRSSHHTH